ncbi:SLOG family protein [Arcticibacter sp.]|uniref:SLOG family protein n=1 Tax=Arcticibacter sp. TaxID=1872630 RepID=UPI00388E5209
MFKCIIAGGRDFKHLNLLIEKCDKILYSFGEDVEIVSGAQVTNDPLWGKHGADYLGEYYATSIRHCKLTRFPADWKTHGKSAGPKRNKQMAEYADGLIAFWDGKSRGTKNMIDLATEHRLKIRVIMY